MTARMRSLLKGFSTTSQAPFRIASTVLAIVPYPVRITISAGGAPSRSVGSADKPSLPGRLRSRNTTSKARCSSRRTASSALAAVSTATPSSCRRLRSPSRTPSSSSTTRIRGRPGKLRFFISARFRFRPVAAGRVVRAAKPRPSLATGAFRPFTLSAFWAVRKNPPRAEGDSPLSRQLSGKQRHSSASIFTPPRFATIRSQQRESCATPTDRRIGDSSKSATTGHLVGQISSTRRSTPQRRLRLFQHRDAAFSGRKKAEKVGAKRRSRQQRETPWV